MHSGFAEPPNETVEKVQFWHSHRKMVLGNKGLMSTAFSGCGVF